MRQATTGDVHQSLSKRIQHALLTVVNVTPSAPSAGDLSDTRRNSKLESGWKKDIEYAFLGTSMAWILIVFLLGAPSVPSVSSFSHSSDSQPPLRQRKGIINPASSCSWASTKDAYWTRVNNFARYPSSIHSSRDANNEGGTSGSSTRNSATVSTNVVFTTGSGGGSGNLRKKRNLNTFVRYLEVECWKRAELRDLEPVLQAIADACKQINRVVQRAQTDDLYGEADIASTTTGSATNIQGEVQQKLDVVCNTVMLRAFCGSSTSIHSVASEEEDTPRCCADIMNDSAFSVGNYLAVVDPIDGSKNIDSSLPVGNIFGIYKCPPGTTKITDESFLQNGSQLVAAGYCLFSATTVLVLTLGSGVDGFTLDPDQGKFLHTHRDIRIPSSGPIYSFNEANFRDFDEPVRRYLTALKEGSSRLGTRMNARYVGALVADVHNILINGGIYGYPATLSQPNGKLRLLYECAPMAMIMEQAGGAGSTGRGRILDVKPTQTHQRIPTYLGSIENVYELDQFYQYYGDETDKSDANAAE